MAGRVPSMTQGTHPSCVIVAFHRPLALERLLVRLCDGERDVVVVNVEADAHVRAIASAVGARLVDTASNVGFAAAVNAGVRAATGDIVVFCNDDVVLDGGDIDALAAHARSTGAVVVPRLLDGKGSVEPTIFALPTPQTLLKEWALLPDVRPQW